MAARSFAGSVASVGAHLRRQLTRGVDLRLMARCPQPAVCYGQRTFHTSTSSLLDARGQFSTGFNAAETTSNSTAVYAQNTLTTAAAAATVAEEVDETEVWLDELVKMMDDGQISLIDVREPSQVAESGSIPSSVNIPLSDLEKAFVMTSGRFFAAYGINKPQKNDDRLVFYALSPDDSSSAVKAVKALGFERARHYVGGWYEWSAMRRFDC